eukprot:1750188-Rhodomonas_salina.3
MRDVTKTSSLSERSSGWEGGGAVLHRQLGDANQKLELAAAALQVPPPYVISGTDRAIPGMRGTLVSYVSRTRNGTCGTGGEYQESNAWY